MKRSNFILLAFFLLSCLMIIPFSEHNTEIVQPMLAYDISQYGEEQPLLMPFEAVVYNYQEMKNALENDNGITSVYFGADIAMQLGGIKINPNKQEVIISGRSPFDPDRIEPYTLTDYSSSAFTNTVYINSDSVNSLIVRDMNIIGKNFYGPFSILDNKDLEGILLAYERVNYNGPQLGYHRRGTIQIEDCSIRIHGENGGSANQEFSEAKHLRNSSKITWTIIKEKHGNSKRQKEEFCQC